ncbi:fungal-specific transcription factor domain-containing protein [Zopfochytrium polystomum]|nr:fungal-specific transcription factor domain-containing protein [Zopfochytrium polystomum]
MDSPFAYTSGSGGKAGSSAVPASFATAPRGPSHTAVATGRTSAQPHASPPAPAPLPSSLYPAGGPLRQHPPLPPPPPLQPPQQQQRPHSWFQPTHFGPPPSVAQYLSPPQPLPPPPSPSYPVLMPSPLGRRFAQPPSSSPFSTSPPPPPSFFSGAASPADVALVPNSSFIGSDGRDVLFNAARSMRSQRVSRRWSCEPCRKRKRKCDGVRPNCGFCVQRGTYQFCVYLGSKSRIDPVLALRHHEQIVADRADWEAKIAHIDPTWLVSPATLSEMLVKASLQENILRPSYYPAADASLMALRSTTLAARPGAAADEQEVLVDAFFRLQLIVMQLVHRKSFLEERGRVPAFLQAAVCAMGAVDPTLMHLPREVLQYYYEIARAQAMDACDDASIVTLQALLILADLSFHIGKTTAGRLLYGAASRMARFLELHIDPDESSPRLSPVEKEVRRRCWWYCYIAEKTTSLMTMRPPMSRTPAAVLPPCPDALWHSLDAAAMHPHPRLPSVESTFPHFAALLEIHLDLVEQCAAETASAAAAASAQRLRAAETRLAEWRAGLPAGLPIDAEDAARAVERMAAGEAGGGEKAWELPWVVTVATVYHVSTVYVATRKLLWEVPGAIAAGRRRRRLRPVGVEGGVKVEVCEEQRAAAAAAAAFDRGLTAAAAVGRVAAALTAAAGGRCPTFAALPVVVAARFCMFAAAAAAAGGMLFGPTAGGGGDEGGGEGVREAVAREALAALVGLMRRDVGARPGFGAILLTFEDTDGSGGVGGGGDRTAGEKAATLSALGSSSQQLQQQQQYFSMGEEAERAWLDQKEMARPAIGAQLLRLQAMIVAAAEDESGEAGRTETTEFGGGETAVATTTEWEDAFAELIGESGGDGAGSVGGGVDFDLANWMLGSRMG